MRRFGPLRATLPTLLLMPTALTNTKTATRPGSRLFTTSGAPNEFKQKFAQVARTPR